MTTQLENAITKLPKKYSFIAWQPGAVWTKFHITHRKNLSSVMCKDTPQEGVAIKVSNAAFLNDICKSCITNFRKAEM